MKVTTLIQLLLLGVAGLYSSSENTYDSLYRQIPTLKSVQNQIDDVDQNYLNPVASSNHNLLTDIHNASLMLANQSLMDSEVASEQADMASEKVDIQNNSIPTMINGLNSTQSTFLSQQNNNRYYAMTRARGVWESIENTTFVNFADNVYNNTVNAITNLSNYVMPIFAFDNATTGSNNQTLANLTARFRSQLPIQFRQLQTILNEQNYINQTSNQLQTVMEPAGEAAVNSAIQTLVNTAFGQFAATNAATEQFQEKELTKNMNLTARNYNAHFNNTVNSLVNSVSNNVNSYLKAVSNMQNLATATQGQASRVASLYALATQSSSVLQSRHDILLGTIKPVVTGIGDTISKLLSQLQGAISASDALMETSVRGANQKLSSTQTALLGSFSQSVSNSYKLDSQQTKVSLQSAQDAVDLRLQQLNSTIGLMLSGVTVLPNSAGVVSNISSNTTVEDANATALAASEVVSAMKKAVFDAVQSQFNQFSSAMSIKLGNLNATAAKDEQMYRSGRTQLLSTIQAGQDNFIQRGNSLFHGLEKSRIDQFSKFNQSLGDRPPYPSVRDASVVDPIEWRSGNLSILESQVNSFEVSLNEFVASLIPKFAIVQNIFNQFNESAFAANLNAAKDGLFASANQNVSDQVQTAIQSFNVSNQSLNMQVDQAFQLIRSNMNVSTSLIPQRLVPAIDLEVIQNSANELLAQAQQSLANVQQGTSQLAQQFSANVSSDEAALNEYVNQKLYEIKQDWTDRMDKNVSTLGGRSSMSNILANISSQLDYSDDEGSFNTAVQSVRDNLQRIKDDLTQAGIQIDMNYKSAVQNTELNLNQIQAGLAKLISLSQIVLSSGTSRIEAFDGSAQAAIDSAVNQTRDAIWTSISNTYFTTLNSFKDYLSYVNGSANEMQNSNFIARSALASSSLELRNLTRETNGMFEDGMRLAGTEREKSINTHKEISDMAQSLFKISAQANAGSENGRLNLQLAEQTLRSSLLSNLTGYSKNFLSEKILNFSQSSQESFAMANRTLAGLSSATSVNLRAKRELLNYQMGNVTSTLFDSSPLLFVLEDLKRVNASIDSRSTENHESLIPIIDALNQSLSQMKSFSGVNTPLQDLLKEYSRIAASVPTELTPLVKAEIDVEDQSVRYMGHKLLALLSERPSDLIQPEPVLETTRKIQILDDLLDDARTKVKRATLRVHKPRDYSSEVKAIREKLDQIKSDHEIFIQKQRDRVQRWLRREPTK